MTASGVVKGYEGLAGAERFAVAIEAMARGDGVEEGRLGGTCPRKVYRTDDWDYRLRLHASFTVAVTTCLGMRADLTLLRVVVLLTKAFPEVRGEDVRRAAVAGQRPEMGRGGGRTLP